MAKARLKLAGESRMKVGSDKFWKLISQRRKQKTMTRTQLERKLARGR